MSMWASLCSKNSIPYNLTFTNRQDSVITGLTELPTYKNIFLDWVTWIPGVQHDLAKFTSTAVYLPSVWLLLHHVKTSNLIYTLYYVHTAFLLMMALWLVIVCCMMAETVDCGTVVSELWRVSVSNSRARFCGDILQTCTFYGGESKNALSCSLDSIC